MPPPSSRPASPSDPDRTWRVAPHPVDAPASQALLLRYHTEVSDRFYGRPTPPEAAARELGAVVVRLDTRHDLVEALGLYAKRGYVDVPAFNADPYAQRWLARRL